jgi:hypothetical protein
MRPLTRGGRPLDDSPSQSMPQSLRQFLFAILGFTIVSLGYNLVARSLGFGLPYSFGYFFAPQNFFSDFVEFGQRFSALGTPEFFHQLTYFMYPPGMVLPLELLYSVRHPGRWFAAVLLLSGGFFTFCFYRILRTHQLARWPAAMLAFAVALTSYPYVTLLLRWNVEVFVWIAVTIGLWCFFIGRYTWAAVLIGFATALKLYPFIFFSLFLSRHRYRDLALGVLTTIATTLLALRTLSPHVGYAFAWNMGQLQALGKYYVAAPMSLGYDHSFFALIKFITLPWLPDLTPVVRPYTWIVAISCLIFYFARIRKLPTINQIMILSVLSVTIAPVSYDYTLLSLYASLAMLCVAALEMPETQQAKLTPFLLLYAVILTPQSYVILRGAHFYGELRAVCLLAIVFLAARRPICTGPDMPSEECRAMSGEVMKP